MKKSVLLLAVMLVFGQMLMAQESRRDQRKLREKEKAAEISKMIGERNLRFIAQFAYPMSGGSIHLTSEYTLDIQNDTVTAFLPFFGRAYYAEYGGRDGGIKFEVEKVDIEYIQDRRGHIARMEVKAPRDIYSLNLYISPSGFATLDVGSVNRQSIRFSGIVVKLKPEEPKD